MKYSRIYQLSPPDQDAGQRPVAAPADRNGDEIHESLFDQLRAAFHTHSRRRIGAFETEAEPALAKALEDYRQRNIAAEALGLTLAKQLQQGLDDAGWGQGGYFWFILEEGGDDELAYLFLLQQEESHAIAPDLTVAAGHSIVPGKLQFAAKIDLAEFGQRSGTCLSCLGPKNQLPLTKAWNAFIGFAEGVDRAAQTEQLLGAIERYADELPPEQEQEYRTRMVDYCMEQNRLGEPVDLQALSRHVDEEKPEAFLQFVEERFVTDQAEVPVRELYTDRNELRRYTRFYGRDQDLSISFSTLMLGQDILYDESSDTLTIRSIPKSLKSQLARHVKKRSRE